VASRHRARTPGSRSCLADLPTSASGTQLSMNRRVFLDARFCGRSQQKGAGLDAGRPPNLALRVDRPMVV
jgi:hypothetical protein